MQMTPDGNRRNRPALLLTLLGGWLLSTSCGVAPRDPEWSKELLEQQRAVDEFEIPTQLAIGFDESSATEIWRAGDQVLYGVRIETPKRCKHWFVRLTLTGMPVPMKTPPAEIENTLKHTAGWQIDDENYSYTFWSNRVPYLIEVFGADGESIANVPYKDFGYARFEQSHIVSASQLSMLAIVKLIQRIPQLDAIFMEAVAMPSLLSMLRHGGVSISLRLDPRERRPSRFAVDADGASVASQRIPLSLDANDSPCLDAAVELTWKRSPFLICQGVLGLHGNHPHDKRKRVIIRLLGARRGVSTAAAPAPPAPSASI